MMSTREQEIAFMEGAVERMETYKITPAMRVQMAVQALNTAVRDAEESGTKVYLRMWGKPLTVIASVVPPDAMDLAAEVDKTIAVMDNAMARKRCGLPRLEDKAPYYRNG